MKKAKESQKFLTFISHRNGRYPSHSQFFQSFVPNLFLETIQLPPLNELNSITQKYDRKPKISCTYQMNDPLAIFNPSSQILITQLPPFDGAVYSKKRKKGKNFFHLSQKWMISLSIFNCPKF